MSNIMIWLGLLFAAGLLVFWIVGLRYIPHQRIGVIEKLWSAAGSLTEGRIVALREEAGFQAEVLRGGLQFWFFPWQYRIHKVPLVTVAEGRIGYVYARDGAPLPPTQTLGAVVDSNHFQDAEAFIENGGQRGRQRAILREGVFAINPALFVVITEDRVYGGLGSEKAEVHAQWQQEILSLHGFRPVVIGAGKNAAQLPALRLAAGSSPASGESGSERIAALGHHWRRRRA